MFSLLAVLVSLHSIVAQQIPFIDHNDLGDTYFFAVHKPAGENPPAKPPINLFLHGAGSVGDYGVLDTMITYNGPGRRLREYYQGNRTLASSLVAEQFLTVLPIHPNDTVYPQVPEWNLPAVKGVLDWVKQHYDYDEDRVYLSGYSLGARDAWKLLIDYPNDFAAAAISAGEPDNTTDFRPMLNIPVQHYAGTKDFEGASNVQRANQTQRAIEALGGVNAELVIIQGPEPTESRPAHNQMADAPFYEAQYQWLLSKRFSTNGATPARTASSSATAVGPTSTTGNGGANNVNAQSSASTLSGRFLVAFFFAAVVGFRS